jgi:hypothetical protein
MATGKISDHAARALDRLKQQFRGKPKVEALVTALMGPVQAVEDALYQLLTERGVDTAIGTQLDAIGKVVGQPRGGLSDDTYRRYIRARITANRSSGLVDELNLIARLVLDDPTVVITTTQYPPASVVMSLTVAVVPQDLGVALVAFLRKATAAGVRILLHFQPQTLAASFAFEGGAGMGFGDTSNAATGGQLVSEVE